MKNPEDPREAVLRGLKSLRRVPHVPGEYLSFRTGLYQRQLNAHDALAGVPVQTRLPVQPEMLSLDPQILARFISQAAGELKPSLPASKKLAGLSKQRGRVGQLVLAAAFGPDMKTLKRLSRETSLPADELLFFGRAAAAPYLSRMLWPIPEKDRIFARDQHPCPFCGSEPGLSILAGETGKRSLACSLCGMEWDYQRVKCPFCGEGNALKTVSEPGRPGRWIEACGSCKRYLKAVDARKPAARERGEKVIALVEAVAGLYLDLIAEKKGFKRNLPYAAMK